MSGRIRTIKPELLEDSCTAALTSVEFRIFISAILLSDDYGNFRAHPGFVHGAVFWATPEAILAETERGLDALEDVALIERYLVRGQQYAHITGWEKHQRVDHPGKPRVPSKDDPESFGTPKSYVYFVQQGDDGPIKIGRAVNIARRMQQLKPASPHALHLRGQVDGGHRESEFHNRFKSLRMAGEWFRPESDLLEFLEELRQHAASRKSSRDTSREVSCLTPTPTCTNEQTNVALAVPSEAALSVPDSTNAKPTEPAAPALQLLPGVPPTTSAEPDPIREVFDHWLEGWRKHAKGVREPKLDQKRRGKVRARMREGYTVDDLKRAIDGMFSTPWNLENKFWDLELVCRDAAHVDRFATVVAQNRPSGVFSVAGSTRNPSGRLAPYHKPFTDDD